jgi:hypothetical protein
MIRNKLRQQTQKPLSSDFSDLFGPRRGPKKEIEAEDAPLARSSTVEKEKRGRLTRRVCRSLSSLSCGFRYFFLAG